MLNTVQWASETLPSRCIGSGILGGTAHTMHIAQPFYNKNKKRLNKIFNKMEYKIKYLFFIYMKKIFWEQKATVK